MNSKNYSTDTLCEKGDNVNRGMGSTLTWHGSPEGRADWTPLYFVRRPSDTDSDAESSSGGKTAYEAKPRFKPRHLGQLLVHAVVSSHVHHNRHPRQNPLIPALGISGVDGEMVAGLYDCTKDKYCQSLG